MNTETKFAEFIAAQEAVYAAVRHELSAGRKKSHWIWFIFPQMTGLGYSHMARKFGIDSLAEAQAYLAHPLLGARLRECIQLMLAWSGHPIGSIMGYPDDLKFRSCLTLFSVAAPDDALFQTALKQFFGGEPDPLTLKLLKAD